MAKELRITKHIRANPEEVFDAWTDPESVERWMRPATGKRSRATLDVHVGGHFKVVMFLGDTAYPHEGEYLKLERPRLIEFTWHSQATDQKRTVVTIEIEPDRDGSKLTLTHRELPEKVVDDHRKGWTEIVDQLANTLTRG